MEYRGIIMDYDKRIDLRIKCLEIVLTKLYDSRYQNTDDVLNLSEIIYNYLAENKKVSYKKLS